MVKFGQLDVLLDNAVRSRASLVITAVGEWTDSKIRLYGRRLRATSCQACPKVKAGRNLPSVEGYDVVFEQAAVESESNTSEWSAQGRPPQLSSISRLRERDQKMAPVITRRERPKNAMLVRFGFQRAPSLWVALH